MYVKVQTGLQIVEVASLASEIWAGYYTPIIGAAQVGYMLEKFQSPGAIGRQISDEGFLYFLITDAMGRTAGYMAVVPRMETGELFLSKIYIRSAFRRMGLAKDAMRFTGELASGMGLHRISLTVNKNNTGAILAYEAMGFLNTGPVVTDIGGGFVMDDHVFEKRVQGQGSG
jgi:ribosomal protein S18 acetylase RimI-like enzyme